MLRTLKMRPLAFFRPGTNSYTDRSGRLVESNQPPTELTGIRGSLQPMSRSEMETIPTKDGVYISTAFWYYTKSGGFQTYKDNVNESDYTIINGVEFIVWAETPWQGIKATTHNVLMLLKRDEVAKND